MKKVILLSVMAIFFWFSPAMAKVGPYVGAGFNYVDITSSGDTNFFDTVDPAFGVDVRFGYNFGMIAVEGNFIYSSHHDSFPGASNGDFYGFSVDARFFVTNPFSPEQVYFLAGVGGYSFHENNNNLGISDHFDGPGFDLGLGFEHYFNPQLSLDLRGVYRFISYDWEQNGFTVATGVNGDTFTLGASLNFHF